MLQQPNFTAPYETLGEVITKHQKAKREKDTLEAEMGALEEYQKMYEIEDDDSPSVLLDKVQQSVHDSICGMF